MNRIIKNIYSVLALLIPVLLQSQTKGLDCTDAEVITVGKTINGNTTNGKSNVSTYNNDPWWQLTGPEKVYRLDWTGGEVFIKLSDKTAALDLLLLNSCNNNDYLSSGGGNSGVQVSIISQHLDSGSYYIVIDGWQTAKGSYTLQVSNGVTVKINAVDRKFFQTRDTVFEYTGNTNKLIATDVEQVAKGWGYVTNSTTGEGQQNEVLYIKKAGQAKPKIFLNENFDTDYQKQVLFCPQKNLSLYGNQVFDGNNQILSGCDVLRCENGYTLAHQQDGKIKLYNPSANNWLDISQIITIDDISYYIKQSDGSVWSLAGSQAQARLIGTNARLLQDNDNQLIKIDPQGMYQRWNGNAWTTLIPKYTSVSPELNDEGFWVFLQAKPLLESTNVTVDHKRGLTYDNSGKLVMDLIPATGNCDRFLWRTILTSNGKRILINKAIGVSNPLLLAANGMPTFTTGQGMAEWDIKAADKNKYGTNAYHLIGANGTQAVSYKSSVLSETPVENNLNQVWLFQFNQMVKDYFLPIPTKTILDQNFTNNPNINLETSAADITKTYNKFLKGLNGVHFFATNTSSDWVIVNYYLVINNMMNAVISPKPSDPKVEPAWIKTLDAMKGQSLILINKNDLNSVVPNQFFTVGFNSFSVASLRGSAGYKAERKWILISEELTNKTGIVNRPLDNTFRRFDHGVHEFGHALQELPGWINIVDANHMCDQERGRSSECFCYDIQTWFNSVGNQPYSYPGIRAYNSQRAEVMKIIFNGNNTWMPPADLRAGGYNPSGTSIIPFNSNFTADVCAKGYKVARCFSGNDNQFQNITVNNLPNELTPDFGLLNVTIEAEIPGKFTSVEPYFDLIDPAGNVYRLFNPASFPQYDTTKNKRFRVIMSACNSGGIPNANDNIPFVENGTYRPMGDNPLNKVNLNKINPNGIWKLRLCTGQELFLKCFQLNFGPTCAQATNHKISTENCKAFVQITYADIKGGVCDDQDGNRIPDYYIKLVGSNLPITVWNPNTHLKMQVPQGKNHIIFGTYYKNNQGIEYYSCHQIIDIDVPFFDTIKPSFQDCPAGVSVILGADGTKFIKLKHPTATDNCGTPVISASLKFLDGATDLGGKDDYPNLFISPGNEVDYSVRGAGRMVFQFIATDAVGNVNTCTTTITTKAIIVDPCASFSPTLSVVGENCLNELTVNAPNAMRIEWKNDNKTVRISMIEANANNFNKYIPTAPGIYTAMVTDASRCVQTTNQLMITTLDIIKPEFQNCPAGVTITLDANGIKEFKLKHPTSTDNCGVPVMTAGVKFLDGATDLGGGVNYPAIGINPGNEVDYSVKGVGRLVFEFKATDAVGNVNTCTTTITTKAIIVDPCASFSPTLTIVGENCLNELTVNAPNALRIEWKNDNSTVRISAIETNANNFNKYIPTAPGIYTALVTDASGCVQTTNQLMINTIDTIKPSFQDCPAGVSVILDADGTKFIKLKHPTTTDNCGTPFISASLKFLDGATDLGGKDDYPNLFISPGNEVDYSVRGAGRMVFQFISTDAVGNVNTCITTITTKAIIVDPCASFSPTLTIVSENCLNELTVNVPNAIRIEWKNDNSTVRISTIEANANKFNKYIPTVPGNYTAVVTNASGCVQTTNQQMVTTIDTVKPEIQNCLPSVTITLDTNGTKSLKIKSPTITDNCGKPVLSANLKYLDGATDLAGGVNSAAIGISQGKDLNYSIKAAGRLVIEFTASDGVGNVNTCTTTITTKDSIVDPCVTSVPTLTITEDCLNEMTVNAPNALRIDWKKDSQIVNTSVANFIPSKEGTTVFSDLMNSIIDVKMDKAGNLYFIDYNYHDPAISSRVLKLAPNTSTAIVVAGGNGDGEGANQLGTPVKICLDDKNNIYVSEYGNHRVTKWAPGADTGIIIAGGNGPGNGMNQLEYPSGLAIDAEGNIYVSDAGNHRVQKWAPGATEGVTAAGDPNEPIRENILDPASIFVNTEGEIFVHDWIFKHVRKFPKNAGPGVKGTILISNLSNSISGMWIDHIGNIYFSDMDANHVIKFPQNSTPTTKGVIVAGGNGEGNAANQLSSPRGLFVDDSGNIFIADWVNSRIQKWSQTIDTISNKYIPTAPGIFTAVVTYANGCVKTTNQVIVNNIDSIKPEFQNCPANVTVTLDTNDTKSIKLIHPTVTDDCGTPVLSANLKFLDGAKDLESGDTSLIIDFKPGNEVEYAVKGAGRLVFEFKATDAVGNVNTCNTTMITKDSIIDSGASSVPTISFADNCNNEIILKAPNTFKIDWKIDNQIVSTSIANFTTSEEGTTVAGTGIAGDSNNQLDEPSDVKIDKAGNIYVADYYNARILKFPPNVATGIVVAGGNGDGPEANQLSGPISICLDAMNNLYVSEGGNHRVTKWAPDATTGIVVAGGNEDGNEMNQLSNPSGVAIDTEGNIYVSDAGNHRIQKWAPGATEGITVAGTGVPGKDLNQITPQSIFVNNEGEIFALEYFGRVKKFPNNSQAGTDGIIIISDIDNNFSGMWLDNIGNIYVSNSKYHRIIKFPPNSTSYHDGVTVAGGNDNGNDANQLARPSGLVVDSTGNIYIADSYNHRIQKWTQTLDSISNKFRPTTPGDYTAMVTTANGSMLNTNTLKVTSIDTIMPEFQNCPSSVTVTLDSNGTKKVSLIHPTISDNCGTPVLSASLKFLDGATDLEGRINLARINTHAGNSVDYSVKGVGRMVFEFKASDAAGNESSCTTIITTQAGSIDPCAYSTPTLAMAGENCIQNEMAVHVTGALRIDWKNDNQTVSTSLAKFTPSKIGTTVAGTGHRGNFYDQFDKPYDVKIDKAGNIYVADFDNHRVLKFAPNETTGVVVAGGNGRGEAANQLNHPFSICLDGNNNLYVSDQDNHRVTKWGPGDTEGIVVAGGNGEGNGMNQLSKPYGIAIDGSGNIYIADNNNNRVQKWAPGSKEGVTFAGTGEGGFNANQVNPRIIFVNDEGELFLTDIFDARVRKFPKNSVAGTDGTYLAIPKNHDYDGMWIDHIGNIYLSSTGPSWVNKFPPNSTTDDVGVVVAGNGFADKAAHQLNQPRGIVVDDEGNIYIADVNNHRIQKWTQSYDTISNKYTPTAPGNYTAVVTNANGCVQTTNQLSIEECISNVVNLSNTSVTKNAYNFEVRTYPNPFTDVVNIEVALPQEDKVYIEFTDVTGKLLKVSSSDVKSKYHTFRLTDLNHTGILFGKVRVKDSNRTIKLLKF